MPTTRWPNSDVRMDTTHAYFSVTLDEDEFTTIAGMPILMELYVNRVKNLMPDAVSGAYTYVNCAGYAVVNHTLIENAYPSAVSARQVAFITSYCPDFFRSHEPSMRVQYWSFRALLRKTHPAQCIGRYLTGSYCRDQPSPDFYPPEVIGCHEITCRGHLGLVATSAFEEVENHDDWKKWLIHPADLPNSAKHQTLIVDEAIRHNPDFVFLDNMAHISYMEAQNDTDAEFVEAYIQHLRGLSKRLNGQGYGAIYNIGKLPVWHRAFAHYPYLEDLFDDAIGNNGIYLEQPFRFRDSSETTEREISKVQALLSRGGAVVFSPYPEGYGDKARAEWMAAMALVIRDPGNAIFVATARDIPSATNQWKAWPQFYGQPSGQMNIVRQSATDWSAQRSFANGDVAVVHLFALKAGTTVPLPVSATGYQVIPGRGPQKGTWDPTTNRYTVDLNPPFDPTRDDGYVDRFILGANPDATGNFYHQLIAVDIVIETTIFR